MRNHFVSTRRGRPFPTGMLRDFTKRFNRLAGEREDLTAKREPPALLIHREDAERTAYCPEQWSRRAICAVRED